MKKKTSHIGFVLGIALFLMGMQEAAASCMGTAYFRAPADWTQAVFFVENGTAPKIVTEKDENGFFSIDLSTITQQAYMKNFGIANTTTNGAGNYVVQSTVWLFQNMYNQISNLATIPCPATATAQVYVAEDPLHPGSTYVGSTPPDAKFFYVLVPEEKEWQSDELMISYTTTQGVRKDTAMLPSPDYCGWHYMVFDTPPSDAILYLKNNTSVSLGINGMWDDDGVADPIDLATVFDAFDVEKLFFIPDDAVWPDEGSQGWYTEYPDVEGTCSFMLAAIIYDSDQDLLNVFTSDPDASGFGACVGVHTGIVKTDLGADGKPVYSGSANAVKCFGSADNFNKLFNYSPGYNEMQCYDMPFRHYGMDTRWGFDSDSTHYDVDGNEMPKGGCNADSSSCSFTGGFYPLEHVGDKYNMTTGEVIDGTLGTAKLVPINGQPQTPNLKARRKRKADAPVGIMPAYTDLDHYCNTPGWFGGVDCGATLEFYNGDNPAAWDWGVREDWQKMNGSKNLLRNQQYCFQSHATFTYNEDQEFTFRGDDDIWVFINKKLAVDNGGAHLAAPGHVVLKNLNTTYGAGFLVPGKDYDLDIFFCDRRTTMTNVIIKTNMYIKQSTGLDFSTEQTPSGGLQLDICVEKSGGGDCASVALGTSGGAGQEVTRECGDQISTQVNFSITTRKGENPPNCSDCSALTPYAVNHGGIDLTNPKKPVVYPDKISGLGPGSYRLVIEVDGKKTHYNFRIKGNLGIVSENVRFDNVDGETGVAYASGTQWTFVDKGLAGTRVPIYISAPDGQGGVDLISAPGQSYSLTLTAGATLYRTKDSNEPLSVPYSSQVNPTGIDTLWLDVPLAGFTSDKLEVTATVGNTSAKITFLAPVVQFAVPDSTDALGNVITWKPVTQDPDTDEDGDEYFHWVSSDVDFYVVVIDPTVNGLCTQCNFQLAVLDKSNGLVEVMVSPLDQGVSLVRIRSTIEYATEAASMVVGAPENPGIAAPYGNMHFYKPPAPMPLIVDLFDVKGAPIGEMNLPSDFHAEAREYLDGRADSMAIIYDRTIDPDSIPSYICLNFDEKNMDKINPFQKGISNNARDTLMNCSSQFGEAEVKAAFDRSPDGGRTLVFAVDEPFSADVKTLVNPENKIASFTEYEWKGKKVKTFFEKGLTDRMAPVIISARASSETDGGVYDQLRIIASEPVTVVDPSVAYSAFSYYLNSAVDIQGDAAKYMHVESQGKPQDKRDTLTLRYYNADAQKPTPHVGDYIRFRADNIVWTDSSNGAAAGADTLRPADDATWHWNSPTNYNSADRLPSPWVQVVGDAKIDVNTIPYQIADPSRIDESTPVGEVFPVKTSENMEDIKTAHPGTLGHFVQSDMGSIIGSDTTFTKVYQNNPHDIYFFYEVDYYTNLGAFVAHQGGKIYCDDPFFSADPTQNIPGDCVKNPRNFFVAWNMLSDKHRLVGTGAYITKYSSFVKVGDKGTKAKKEVTEVWGVKRGSGVVK